MKFINSALLDLMLSSNWFTRGLENPSFTESEQAQTYNDFYNKLDNTLKKEFDSLIHKMSLNYERVYLNNATKMINPALQMVMETKEILLDVYEQ